MKAIFSILGLTIILVFSLYLYHLAQVQSTYQGLPTVPCLDYTKPVIKEFTFSIRITVEGNNFPLDKTIGHDYGNCLHDIFVNNSSGRVHVKLNNNETFTLGQFFDVWHKTFSRNQIFGYQTDNTHTLQVLVNGRSVNTYRKTILRPNQNIQINYKNRS